MAEQQSRVLVASVGLIHSHLSETNLLLGGIFILPNSIAAITPLVGRILIELEKRREKGEITQVYLFYNRPKLGAIYTPVSQRLLPLDDAWRRNLTTISWPTGNPATQPRLA